MDSDSLFHFSFFFFFLRCRYQFFLQVKKDILQGRLPVTTELAAELAALALQCKLLPLIYDFHSKSQLAAASIKETGNRLTERSRVHSGTLVRNSFNLH